MSVKTVYCTPKLQPVRAANGTSAQMPLRKGGSLSLGTGVMERRHERSHKRAHGRTNVGRCEESQNRS